MKQKVQFFTILICIFSGQFLFAQPVVTKSFAGTVAGAVCPQIGIDYEVSVPSGFGGCTITWTATNGVKTVNQSNPTKVSVVWSDTPGAIGTIRATFSNCGTGNEGSNGVFNELSELILSVKGQNFDSYTNSVSVNFCTTTSVYLIVPPMVVSGTGGFNQPMRQEVAYVWTLPPGWKEIISGLTGEVITASRDITIIPTACAEPGIVSVKGTIRGPDAFCGSSALSNSANITINSSPPIVTVVPEAGYAGSTACNITPVTFTAVITNDPGCTITSYTWTPSSSWTLISQSGNTAVLRPSGSSADASAIKCKVTFGCNSTRESTFTPTFNPPVISGFTPVCSSKIYTVGNAQGLQIDWASSNTAIATINSSGLLSRVGTENGSVTISATLPCSVVVPPKIVWVGKPIYTSVTYDGILTPIVCEGLYQSFTSGDHILATTTAGATAYPNFILDTSSPYVHGSANGNNFNFNVNSKKINYEFIIRSSITNSCGSVSTCTYFTNWAARISSFPNPSDNEVNVQLDGDGEFKNVTLYNSRQEQVFTTGTTEKELIIETGALPDGIYVVKIVLRGKVISHHLQVKH